MTETSLLLFKGQGKGKSNGNSGPALETTPQKQTPEEVHVTPDLTLKSVKM